MSGQQFYYQVHRLEIGGRGDTESLTISDFDSIAFERIGGDSHDKQYVEVVVRVCQEADQ